MKSKNIKTFLVFLSPMAIIWILTIYFRFDVSTEHFKMNDLKYRLESRKTYLQICEFAENKKFKGVISKISEQKGGAKYLTIKILEGNAEIKLEDKKYANKISFKDHQLTIWLDYNQKHINLELGDTVTKKKNSYLITSTLENIDIRNYWRNGFINCSDALNMDINKELKEYLENYSKARVKEKLNQETTNYLEHITKQKIIYPK